MTFDELLVLYDSMDDARLEELRAHFISDISTMTVTHVDDALSALSAIEAILKKRHGTETK